MATSGPLSQVIILVVNVLIILSMYMPDHAQSCYNTIDNHPTNMPACPVDSPSLKKMYADASEKITQIIRRAMLIREERKLKGLHTSVDKGSVLSDLDRDIQDAALFSVVPSGLVGLETICAYECYTSESQSRLKLAYDLDSENPFASELTVDWNRSRKMISFSEACTTDRHSMRIVAGKTIYRMADKICALLPDRIAIPIIAIDDPCYIAFIYRYVLVGKYTLSEIIIEPSENPRVLHGVLLFIKRMQPGYTIPSVYLVPMTPVETRDFYVSPNCSNIHLHPVYHSKIRYTSQRDALLDNLCKMVQTTSKIYCMFVEETTSVCFTSVCFQTIIDNRVTGIRITFQ